jgi:hypothetical protein
MSYILVRDTHPWRRTASFTAATLSILGILGASGGVWMILNDKIANGIVASAIGLIFLSCAFVVANIVRVSAKHDDDTDRQAAFDGVNKRLDEVYTHMGEKEDAIYRRIEEIKSEMDSDIKIKDADWYREIDRLNDRIDSVKPKR